MSKYLRKLGLLLFWPLSTAGGPQSQLLEPWVVMTFRDVL